MKKSRKKINKSAEKTKEGSITIFLTLILLSVMLLTGSMIDVSRIMVADNKMDSAIRAATKSLMAEYDAELIGAYGMFGVKLQENKEVFADYMEKNLKLSSSNFLKYDFMEESASSEQIEGADLGNLDYMQEQINSYMALKGPINFGSRTAVRALNTIKAAMEKGSKIDEQKSGKSLEKINKPQFDISGTSMDSVEIAGVEKDLSDLEKKLESEGAQRKEVIEDFEKNLKNPQSDENKTGLEEIEINYNYDDTLSKIKENVKSLKELAGAIADKKADLEDELDKPSEDRDYIKIRALREEIEELSSQYGRDRKTLEEDVKKYSKGDESYSEGEIEAGDKYIELLENIRENVKTLNTTIDNVGSSETELIVPDSENTDSIFSAFKKGTEELSSLEFTDVTKTVGDAFNNIEYVLDRCTYVTSPVERELSKFKFGEVEYILHGAATEYVNILASITEIYMLCLVVNILDLILLGIPVFPAALIGGAVYAVISTVIILSGGSYVPLKLFFMKSAPNAEKVISAAIGMTYLDFMYLRLLTMTVTGGAEKIKLRLQNLIRNNMEASSMSDFKTGIKTQASTRVNLIFLPLFPLEAMHLKGFEENGYIISKEYEFAYQELIEGK